jgi:hypothetical protein
LALEALARIAPWRAVSDQVLFEFEGVPELQGVLAILLGQAGEQRGVALYPSHEDYWRFLEAAMERDLDALAEVEALNLYLDPIAEFEPSELEVCREAGLVTSNDLCPRVLVLAGGVPSLANDHAQRVLLAAIQGITALTARDAHQLEFEHTRCVASTCLGVVEVRSTSPGWMDSAVEPDLVDVEHSVGVGRIRDAEGMEVAALVIKMRKGD